MITCSNLDGNDEEIFGLMAIIGLKEIFGLMAMITDDGGNIAVTQVLASVSKPVKIVVTHFWTLCYTQCVTVCVTQLYTCTRCVTKCASQYVTKCYTHQYWL